MPKPKKSKSRVKSRTPKPNLKNKLANISRKQIILFILTFAIIGVCFQLVTSAYRTIGNSTGTFNAYCDFSHRSNDDAIVFPGQVGAAHMHDFFGSRSTDAFSTNQSIQQSPTSCQRFSSTNAKDADKSAYWIPTLYVNDQIVTAHRLTAMYKSDFRSVRDIKPFPAGLRVIAGTSTGGPSETPNHKAIWFFECHGTETIVKGSANSAPTCKETSQPGFGMQLVIRFPDCWDGVNLDSSNHKSHMTYSQRISNSPQLDGCPSTHPVLVPSMQFIIEYPTIGGPTTRFSSGAINTAHADFMNGWPQDHLTALVQRCLNIDNYCGGADYPVPGHAGNELDSVTSVNSASNYSSSVVNTSKSNKSSTSPASQGSTNSAGGSGSSGQSGNENPHSAHAGSHPGSAKTTYAVSVMVKNQRNQPIKGAKVVLGNLVSFSDADGIAAFRDVAAGRVEIKASSTGNSSSKFIDIKDNGEPTAIQKFEVNINERLFIIIIAAIVGTITIGLIGYRLGVWKWAVKRIGH